MVGTDTHGDVDIVLLFGDRSLLLFLEGHILQACQLLLGLDNGLEHVGIIVRVLALKHADKTFEAHTRINYIHRKFLQRAVSLAVELHKHEIPDLNHLRIVLVHQVAPTDA